MADVCYPRLHKAVRWASKLHKNQDRDGANALPYLTHVMEVVSNLRYVGGVTDEDMLCAAALHDVVEQSEVPFSKIESRFGTRVRGLVEEMTRREPTADETKGMNASQIWKLRSDILLAEIKKMSPDAKRLKLADRLSNVRSAKQTKIADKLDRTMKQTEEILRIIPRTVNPAMWDAIDAEMERTPAHAVVHTHEATKPLLDGHKKQRKKVSAKVKNKKEGAAL